MPRRSKATIKPRLESRVTPAVKGRHTNPFGEGPIVGRVRRNGVPLVESAADPTQTIDMCPGELRPEPVFLTSADDVEANHLYTYDLRCAKPRVKDADYLQEVRTRQDKVRRFLDQMMFDIHVMDKYSTRNAEHFKKRFAEPDGRRKRRELTKAYNDLLHAYTAVDREIMWCVESLNRATGTVDPEKIRVVRNTLEQYGCSPDLTERMFDAAKVLYYKRMQRLKQLFRNIIADFDVTSYEKEWNDIGRRQHNFVFKGVAYISLYVQTSVRNVAKRLRRYCDWSVAAQASATIVSITINSFVHIDVFSWTKTALSGWIGGMAGTVMAPIYLCFFAQNLEYYIKCADLCKKHLWNWATGEGPVDPAMARIFEEFTLMARQDVGLRSALYRSAHTANADQNEEMKRRAINPTNGMLASMFGVMVDELTKLMSHEYSRYVMRVCGRVTSATRAVAGVANAESYLMKGIAGVKALTDMKQKVPQHVNQLYAAAAKDMEAVVDELSEVAVEKITLWKADDGQDMMTVVPEVLEKFVPGIDLDMQTPAYAVPVSVVSKKKPSAIREFLNDILSKENQLELAEMAANTNKTLDGYLSPIGEFIEAQTGMTPDQQVVGANYLAAWLLWIGGGIAVMKLLKPNTEDPIIFTEEDVQMVERLEKERGDLIERSLMLYGRVNPVPNPQAVYERCAALGGEHDECVEAVRRSTEYACVHRGCTAPDPLVSRFALAVDQAKLPMED